MEFGVIVYGRHRCSNSSCCCYRICIDPSDPWSPSERFIQAHWLAHHQQMATAACTVHTIARNHIHTLLCSMMVFGYTYPQKILQRRIYTLSLPQPQSRPRNPRHSPPTPEHYFIRCSLAGMVRLESDLRFTTIGQQHIYVQCIVYVATEGEAGLMIAGER